jgi:hypothetical protein
LPVEFTEGGEGAGGRKRMEVVDVEKVGLEEACVGREESALFF